MYYIYIYIYIYIHRMSWCAQKIIILQNFGNLLKNIPAPNEKTYKLQLIEKVKFFIKKLRWKVIFLINNSKGTTESCKID